MGDVLLSESHMRHHPLTPMTDASLVRVLARQTRHKVGLVALKQVQAGSASLRAALDTLSADHVRHVVVDAVADADLGIIGEAVGDDALVTGGSGVALGLPAAYRRRGLLQHRSGADSLPSIGGASAVLAGSCSAATLGQISNFKGAHMALDTDAICRGEDVASAALGWAKDNLGNGPILLSAGQRHARGSESASGQVRRREIKPGDREDHGRARQGAGRGRCQPDGRRAGGEIPAPLSAPST